MLIENGVTELIGLPETECHGNLRRGTRRHSCRGKAIDDVLNQCTSLGGQLELDLPKSIPASRSAQNPHDIVVDLSDSAVLVIVERQALPNRLELYELAEGLAPDDASGHLRDPFRNGFSAPRQGHLGPLPN